MKKGEWIRWSSTDDEGPFHYVGQITKIGKDYVEFQDSPTGGSQHVPLEEGVFTKARKPKSWKAPTIKKSKSKPIAKPKASAPMKKGSKKEAAKAIFKDGIHRSEIIERFMSELGMSKAGATTYYSNFNSGRW